MRKRIIAALLSLAMTSSVFCTLPSVNAEILKGDVESDGVIDVTDVSYLSLYLIGDIDFSDDLKKVADVDGDGEVRLTDLAMIRQFVSKKIDSLGGILSDEPDDSELTDITADSKTIIAGGDFSNRYITGKSLMISSMDAYDKYIGIDTEENENIAKQGIEVSDEFFKKNRLAVMVDNSEGCNGVDFKLTAVKLDKKDNVHLYYDKKVPDLMTELGNITHYITVVPASDNKESETVVHFNVSRKGSAEIPGTSSLSKDALAVPVYSSSRTVADKKKADSYSAFAAAFTDDVLLNTDDENDGINRVYSPISIYMATSMLAECCEGESLAELLGLLEVSDKNELAAINKNVFDSLYFDNDSYCRINNSIWIDRRFTPAEDTIKNLADKYYAASFLRDLGSPDDCKEITKWISDNTAGKFEPEILSNPDAVLKIINTVIFKDSWELAFSDTETGKFKGADSDIECQFMKVYDRAGIALDEDFTTYIKSYRKGYEMNFVLPADGKTVKDLVSDETVMQRIFERKDRCEYDVTASVPKFSSKSKFNIIDTLTDIGITSIFDKADLGPLLGDQTSAPVDEFVHEAVIDVDENGCEAAAYTLIGVDECAYPHYEFNADRPFLYFISNENGVPVFIGIVNDPTQK